LFQAEQIFLPLPPSLLFSQPLLIFLTFVADFRIIMNGLDGWIGWMDGWIG